MINAQIRGDGMFTYSLSIAGFMDKQEYRQFLENLEEVKKEVIAAAKMYGYEEETNE